MDDLNDLLGDGHARRLPKKHEKQSRSSRHTEVDREYGFNGRLASFFDLSEKQSQRLNDRHHHHHRHSRHTSKHRHHHHSRHSDNKLELRREQEQRRQERQYSSSKKYFGQAVSNASFGSNMRSAKCSVCNLCRCQCRQRFTSSFVDDGSWLDRILNMIDTPYGYVSGVDTPSYDIALSTTTGLVTLTPIVGATDTTGLGPTTQPGQTFFIGSTIDNDPSIPTWGMFEIISLPSPTNDTYVLAPKEMESEGGIDLIKILYAAPITKACVSADNVYDNPDALDDSAVIYEIASIDATTGFWTLESTETSNLSLLQPVHAAS